MSDFDDLDTSIGFSSVISKNDVFCVDFDYHENTGELSDLFDETDLDQYIDNLNDWD